MTRSTTMIEVYLEVGQRRTVAGALDWPGWCRIGRDEAAALHALLDYGPRYARALGRAGLDFQPPAERDALVIVERLTGSGTTDFGVPDVAPASDTRPLDEAGLQRLQLLLTACWRAFDAAIAAASGRQLRTGPRGGGRNVESIMRHVLGAEQSYQRRLAWKQPRPETHELSEERDQTLQATLAALAAAARGELPSQGPRGGVLWTPRYFVRRAAWHVLDHAWEIEDRII